MKGAATAGLRRDREAGRFFFGIAPIAPDLRRNGIKSGAMGIAPGTLYLGGLITFLI